MKVHRGGWRKGGRGDCRGERVEVGREKKGGREGRGR